MSRFLLSVASIFVLLITNLLLPRAADARRCDDRMPLTLLALYRTSDAIYVGRYEKIEDGEVIEDTPEYKTVQIKKHFSISSALKGEPRKMLAIADTDYRYKEADASHDAGMEHGDDVPDEDVARPGDSVLLFLAKDAETGDINLTEMSDGIKKMTPDRLSAYEARIKELKGILSAEKPKYSKLVEWMIRCAENPLTRWEGTFELLQSFQNVDWQEERARQPKVEIVSGITEEFVPEPPKNFETGDLNFARSLTDAHKRELTNILTKRERPKTENGGAEPAMVHGDRELIELVKRWGDSRVAGNLLEQLRQDSSDANLNAEFMASIASMLKDDELSAISDEYYNIQWEIDQDTVRVESEEQAPSEAVEPAVTAQTSDTLAAIEPEPVPSFEIEPNGPDAGGKSKKTYGMLKAELLEKFIGRAEDLIAKENNKKIAKLNR